LIRNLIRSDALTNDLTYYLANRLEVTSGYYAEIPIEARNLFFFWLRDSVKNDKPYNQLVNELLAQLGPAVAAREPVAQPLFLARTSAPLLDAVLRLARLLDTPEEASVLAPLALREIHYPVLPGQLDGPLRPVVPRTRPRASTYGSVAPASRSAAAPLSRSRSVRRRSIRARRSATRCGSRGRPARFRCASLPRTAATQLAL